MIATVDIRDLSIADCDRWATNEKAASQSRQGAFLFVSCECTVFAFADNNFWSSTEYSTANAWSQDFISGYPGNQTNGYTKTAAGYVRAFRRLAL